MKNKLWIVIFVIFFVNIKLTSKPNKNIKRDKVKSDLLKKSNVPESSEYITNVLLAKVFDSNLNILPKGLKYVTELADNKNIDPITKVAASSVLGQAYYWNLNSPKSIKYYEDVIKYYPDAIKSENDKKLSHDFINETLSEAYDGLAGYYFYTNFDYFKAFEYYNKELLLDPKDFSPYGFYNLALMYYYGKGTIKNLTKANEFFKKTFDEFNNYISSKDTDQKTYSTYLTWLAFMYYYGLGIKQNYSLAFKNFTSVINNFSNINIGNALQAKNALATMYFAGLGIPKNETLAFKYLNDIVNDTHTDPLTKLEVTYSLGLSYCNGSGVVQNVSKGIEYYNKVIKDFPVALKYYKQELSNIINMPHTDPYKTLALTYYDLGNIYYFAESTTQDYPKAFEYFSKSIQIPSIDSYTLTLVQNRLGIMYFYGQGITIDLKMAKDYLSKAFNGFNDIISNPQNPDTANCNKQSVQDVANFYLGEFYNHGYGVVTENKTLARIYYQKVTPNNNFLFTDAQNQLKELK